MRLLITHFCATNFFWGRLIMIMIIIMIVIMIMITKKV